MAKFVKVCAFRRSRWAVFADFMFSSCPSPPSGLRCISNPRYLCILVAQGSEYYE